MALASRGLRDLDDGPQGITDEEEKAALRAQARLVYRDATAWAVVLTFVALALPQLG